MLKPTLLKVARKFKVRQSYALHLGGTIYEGGTDVLVATEEMLQAVESQRWKVEEVIVKLQPVPVVPEPIPEPVSVSTPKPILNVEQDAQLDSQIAGEEDDEPEDIKEDIQKAIKAKVVKKPLPFRKGR
jgi:hypothetical protein